MNDGFYNGKLAPSLKLSRNNWHWRQNNPQNITVRPQAQSESRNGTSARAKTPAKQNENVNVDGRETSKSSNGGKIFAADVCTHTRIYTHAHTHWQGYAHTLAHSYTQTSCSECGSLGLALPQACGNSPESSSAVRLLPHAKREIQHLPATTTARFYNFLKNPRRSGPFNMHWKYPYLSELSTAAFVFCLLERCIEMVGARRVGEKNRRPTSQYSVQSCAIEIVERTIFLSTVAAEKRSEPLSDLQKGNDCVFFTALSGWLLRCHLHFD